MKYHLPQLEPMLCDKGCGECCGIVPCTLDELQAIRGVVKARGIKPVKQGATCPLYINGECSVYTVRPALCRLFGHVDGMVCSRGYSAPITDADLAAYHAHLRATSVRTHFTHEIVFTKDEMMRMGGIK